MRPAEGSQELSHLNQSSRVLDAVLLRLRGPNDKPGYSGEQMWTTFVTLLFFPPWNASQFPSKEKFILSFLFLWTSLFHFWNCYDSLSNIRMTTTDLLKCHPRSPRNGEKGKNKDTVCQSQYLPGMESLFVLSGGCRELTKGKQNSSVSKHEPKMISLSEWPCVSRTQIQSGPGLRKCLWSRGAINMPSFKTTQSHTNIKQTG